MASGWNLWVWLKCKGVVIIIVTFPYSTCISSFLAAASLFLGSFLKCFFVLVAYNFGPIQRGLTIDITLHKMNIR